MTISIREQALYAKLESTFGTFNTPVSTDALQVMNLKPNPAENLRWITREVIRASLGEDQGLYGGALMGFDFDVELKGSGTAGTAPRFGPLLQACGLQETIVGGTSVTYRPFSTIASHKGVSIGYKAGGVYRTAKGCRGNVSMTLAAGMPGKLSFKMVGHINTEADAAAPALSSLEATRPPPFLSAGFTIGAFSCPIAELSLDLGNTVAISPDPNSSDGYGEVRVTARKLAGKVNPEAKLIATKDYVGIFRTNTTQTINTGTIGGTAGNRWALQIGTAYFMNVPFGDRDALLTHEIEFGAAETSSGDDEFTLTLT